MHQGELVLKEIYVEVKQLAQGQNGNFFIKPLTLAKADALLKHVAQMGSQLEAYKKALDILQDASKKLEKAKIGIEAIATSEFPTSAAKADLLQEQATRLYKEIS